MAKKKATKKKAAKSSKKEVLVVASKVKAYVKGKKMMTSSDGLTKKDSCRKKNVEYLTTGCRICRFFRL